MENGIAKKFTLVKVESHKFYFTKRDDLARKEIAEKRGAKIDTYQHVRRFTINKEKLKDLHNTAYNRINAVLDKYCTHFERGGWYALNINFYTKFNKEVREAIDDLENAKKELREKYQDLINEARIDCGSSFDETDYPPIDEVLDRYSLTPRFRPFPEKDHFVVEAANEIQQEIKDQFEKEKQEALLNSTRQLWDKVMTRLTHLAERLRAEYVYDENGAIVYNKKNGQPRKPRIHDSVIEGIHELIELLPLLNIANDPKLEQARQLMENTFDEVTIEDIKNSEKTKEVVAYQAEEMAKAFNSLMS